MSTTEICNAVIESVSLGDDEHGGMTFWLYLDYGHSGQGFGSFSLGGNEGPPLVFMHLTVREILRVIGVRTWEDLKGKPCRAEIEDGLVRGIGNITKNCWFRPKDAYAPYQDAEWRVQQTTGLIRDAEALLKLFVRLKGEDFAAEQYEVRRVRERIAKARGDA